MSWDSHGFLQYPQLDLGDGQGLADMVVEVVGQTAPFPLLRQGEFRGQGLELLLIGPDLVLGLFALGDVLGHDDGKLGLPPGSPEDRDRHLSPRRSGRPSGYNAFPR